jgi:small subunit ribosomal protein S4e
MSNRGKSRHMKSLAAPKYFGINRKAHVYIGKPNPGRHSLDRCVSLSLALRKTNIAASTGEAMKIITTGNVLVNNKSIREWKFPVGLNDIIEIKGAGIAYKIGIDEHAKITFEEDKKPNYNAQLYRVIGKYKTTKGEIMLRLHDGSIAKGKNEIKVNDSIKLDSKRAVKDTMAMAVGAECLVISGVHVGTNGRVKSIKKGTEKQDPSAVIAPKQGEEFETIIKNIMITG